VSLRYLSRVPVGCCSLLPARRAPSSQIDLQCLLFSAHRMEDFQTFAKSFSHAHTRFLFLSRLLSTKAARIWFALRAAPSSQQTKATFSLMSLVLSLFDGGESTIALEHLNIPAIATFQRTPEPILDFRGKSFPPVSLGSFQRSSF